MYVCMYVCMKRLGPSFFECVPSYHPTTWAAAHAAIDRLTSYQPLPVFFVGEERGKFGPSAF